MIDEMKINAIQREKYLSKGYWKDITLLDCWKESVKKYSEREYVVDDRGNRYTYRQMDEAASKVAAFLRKQGVLPGDAVSFQLPIWSEFVVVTIACFMTGAVAHHPEQTDPVKGRWSVRFYRRFPASPYQYSPYPWHPPA